jgi:Asp-tRNA(Asn)/Glu-tRNA(Gln) amidotransferase B subunit
VKAIAALLANDVLGEIRAKKLDAVAFDGAALVELARLTDDGTISSKQAKDVLAEMIASGKRPRAIVEEKGRKQIANADALEPVIAAVLAENADAVGRYKSGNANVFGALVGMIMKKTKGQANPKLVTELLKAKLGS